MFKGKCNSRSGNLSFYMPRSKTLAQRNLFYFVVQGFKAETFSLLLTKNVKVDLKNSFSKMIQFTICYSTFATLNHVEKDAFCAQRSCIFCL